ncbi:MULTISPECIES: thioredoxin-disulfide reductase [unclassified Arthrobacter]|uniref:thioredoxin-disulfide reductase n=1 Tax=unclassified Arthrobacter TaxID=235627 RepID=UPI00149213AF|nr:thioredoxin-disulfide reductase [Arthrobacter sp. AET 35A]MBE0008503.1 thioredoxin-disulfide reductase [Arthrobacter sp. AET 35A]
MSTDTGVSGTTSNDTQKIHDVIIVGSGPAGYTAAVYTARANLAPLMIASSVKAGGELMNTTDVENYPGFPEGVMGPDLMEQFEKQAIRFGTEILFEDVTKLELSDDIKRVTIGTGETYLARSIIVSTGSEYRELGLEDEKRLSGHGVSWCATCDGFFFKDQDIAVIGGGDSAMEEALFLTKFARSVTVVHRRDTLRASKIMQDRALGHEKIRFIWNSEVVGIDGDAKVTGLRLASTVDDSTQQLDVTGVFVAIGNDPRVDLVKDLLELTSEGTIAVQGRTSKTSLPGVFAAGDVIDPTYRQAITASGSGCVAAIDVEHYLADLGDSVDTAAEVPTPPAEQVSEEPSLIGNTQGESL